MPDESLPQRPPPEPFIVFSEPEWDELEHCMSALHSAWRCLEECDPDEGPELVRCVLMRMQSFLTPFRVRAESRRSKA